MKLAVIDAHGNVLISWPSVESAHADIADQAAAAAFPGRLQKRSRVKAAAAIRAHLLELQAETTRL